MNCCSYDGAAFDIAAGVGGPEWVSFRTKEYLGYEVPQYLRPLQQCSVMSIGLLEPSSFCKTSGCYLRLNKEPFYRWLGGEQNIHPVIHSSQEAVIEAIIQHHYH